MSSHSSNGERPGSLADLKDKAFVNQRRYAREQDAHEKAKAKLKAAEERNREYEEKIAALKRKRAVDATDAPAMQSNDTTGEHPAAKNFPATSTVAQKRPQNAEVSVKKRKTAHSSSALRDTRPNITNKVYNIFNSHKVIVHTNGSMPGADFVPTLPPRKRLPVAAPAAPAAEPTLKRRAGYTGLEIEQPEEVESEPARPATTTNRFPGLIEGAGYEIEEILEETVEITGWKSQSPCTATAACLRKEASHAVAAAASTCTKTRWGLMRMLSRLYLRMPSRRRKREFRAGRPYRLKKGAGRLVVKESLKSTRFMGRFWSVAGSRCYLEMKAI